MVEQIKKSIIHNALYIGQKGEFYQSNLLRKIFLKSNV